MTIKHIVFPYDFSCQGQQAAPFVRAFADRFGARVTLLSVVPPVWDIAQPAAGVPGADSYVDWVQTLRRRLDEALPDAFGGIPVERVALSGDPALRVVDYAGTMGADLIMMPTHGVGTFRSLLVGSVTAKVLHDARCAVWTAAHAREQRSAVVPKTVLCAIDGSGASVTLIQQARDISAQFTAALTLLHVVGPVTDLPFLASERRLQDQARDDARGQLETIKASAGVDAPLRVSVGPIAETVTEEARQEGADLIVIGRGALNSPLGRLRTHAFGIIQRAACPVLSI
jgi:nucleotide-binding universal stress UspA family protein